VLLAVEEAEEYGAQKKINAENTEDAEDAKGFECEKIYYVK